MLSKLLSKLSKPNSIKCFSTCYWNLNSIISHFFIKVSHLSAYNAVHNFGIIFIYESYLNSQIFFKDDRLSIPGYNMFRVDHPLDNQHKGLCVYCKESLPIRLYNISYIEECICFNFMISNKLCSIVLLYRSANQNSNEFENLFNNFNLNLESITKKKCFSIILLDHFHAKHNNWCSDYRPTHA